MALFKPNMRVLDIVTNTMATVRRVRVFEQVMQIKKMAEASQMSMDEFCESYKPHS
jgi:hypothetical protein